MNAAMASAKWARRSRLGLIHQGSYTACAGLGRLLALFVFAALPLVGSPGPVAQFIAPEPTDDVLANDNGHIDLVWELSNPVEVARFELESAREADFAKPTLRYSGPDRKSFVSGLAAGDYYFRVRAVGDSGTVGPWSGVLAVEVAYVTMWKVATLMSVGLVCLLATAWIIIGGTFKTEDRILETS